MNVLPPKPPNFKGAYALMSSTNQVYLEVLGSKIQVTVTLNRNLNLGRKMKVLPTPNHRLDPFKVTRSKVKVIVILNSKY